MSEEAIVAAQDPVEEHQYLVEEEGNQDTNLNMVNYTTDQGKPRCISPIITISLSHVYLYILCIYVLGVDSEPTCIDFTC